MQKPVGLLIQVGQLACEIGHQVPLDALLSLQPGFQRGKEILAVALREADGGVVPLNRILDRLDAEVGKVADVFIAAHADEVGVLTSLGLHVDEAVLTSRCFAASAPQDPLEVVVVDLHVHPGARSGVENVLDPVKEFLVNERLMAPFVELCVVEDPSRVVGIAENSLDCVSGDGAGSYVPSGRPSLETLILHHGGELRDAVLPRGIELEHQPYEWGAFLIDADAVDQVAVDGDASVEISDGSTGDRAAVLGLMSHLELHVLPIEAVLELVHGIGDRRHSVTLEGVAEVLLRRYELDAEHAQIASSQHRVLDIAECARTAVDDDGSDLWVLRDVGQHLPEDRSLLHRLSTPAWLDELLGDDQA